MRRFLLPALLLSALLVAACAGPAPPPCPAGMAEARSISGFFGQTVADGTRRVTSAEWASFRAAVLTPLFPAGSTVTAGRGAWRHADGRVLEEDTMIVTLLVPAAETGEALSRLRQAMARYSALHPQEAVGLTLHPLCVAGFFPADRESR
jgi:hypothetical protein